MSLLVALVVSLALAAPERAVGYHGDFVTHPGASVRLAWDQGGTVHTRVDVEAETVLWWHPDRMVALSLRAGPAVRYTGPHHGTWGAFVHLGAVHGTWAAPTYVVDDGDVRRGVLRGRTWLQLAGGLELGRQTPRAPWFDGWFVRPQVGLRAPTALSVAIDPAVQVGVRW